MRFKDEEGQAIIIVALAMSIFLILAIGLAVDGSSLYSQRQMAQAAADAAAQAGIMSIFDGTNSIPGNTAGFTAGTAYTCTTTDQSTPCVYASKNGFGGSAIDTVAVSFPADTAFPGVAFSSDPFNVITVSVSRNVNTTLMRMFPLSPSATTVTATATAAIVAVISPTPILVTHPSLTSALSMVGATALIKICGGPSRSIEVNSSDPSAFSPGTAGVDLSHAGTAGKSDCSVVAGADFGVWGGPTSNPNPGQAVNLGSGKYLAHASWIDDPFANVNPPPVPGNVVTSAAHIANGVDGCVISVGCTEYSPGLYNSSNSFNKGLDLTGVNNVIFKPGIYYIQGSIGLVVKNTTGGGINNSSICVGCSTATTSTTTGSGMLIYDTGPSGGTLNNNPSGGFNVSTLNNISFQGPTLTTHNANGVNGCTTSGGCDVPAAPYYNIAFWEDRSADPHTQFQHPPNQHLLGQGTGCFQVTGSIYLTNTRATMITDSTHYQGADYGGTPCSTTVTQGDIIVGTLRVNGNGTVTMNLVPFGFLTIRQVALIN
jgi:Flp pilus assembly protein TadG